MHILNFGKYSGVSIESVYKNDPGYVLKFIWSQTKPSYANFRDIKSSLKQLLNIDELKNYALAKRTTYSKLVELAEKYIDPTTFSIEDAKLETDFVFKEKIGILLTDLEKGLITEDHCKNLISKVNQHEHTQKQMYYNIWTKIYFSEKFLMFQEAKDQVATGL